MAKKNFETGLTSDPEENAGFDKESTQQWFEDKMIENMKENLMLVALGKKPEIYGQNVFLKMKKVGDIFTETTNTSTVPETDFKEEIIVIERNKYSIAGTIYNTAEEFGTLDSILEIYATEFSEAAVRKTEAITQKMITDYLNTNSTKWKQMVVTGGTESDIGNINAFTSDNTSTTKITMDNIFKARSLLVGRLVEGFGNANGRYIGLMHPACAHTLEFDAVGNTEQGMMDLKAGAIGTKFGITFYEYPFAQALASKGKGNPDVYPTFILGRDAFFRLNWDALSTDIKDIDSSNSNATGKKIDIRY